MPAKRPRINRRLTNPDDAANVVTFRDGWGAIRKSFDLGKLSLPADVTALLTAAFAGHHAVTEPSTKRICWGTLTLFAQFVANDGRVKSVADLNTEMVHRYKAWLDARTAKSGRFLTAHSKAFKLSSLRQLFDWTKRHHPQRLPSRLDFPANPYPNRVVNPRTCLPAHQLKAILRVCYEEIDEAWAHFQTGQAILASTGVIAGSSQELCECVRLMAAVGKGIMPSMEQMKDHRFNSAMLARQGGLRATASYLHLTPDKLAAFFIAITIQTAGNADSIRRMQRDCQVPHPLDEHRVMLDWGKARAGLKIKRAQRRSFDMRRPYAAPHLVTRVLAMTGSLRAHSSPRDQNLLFLVKSEKTNIVTEVSGSTLGAHVRRFISRANERIAIWNEAAPERRREFLPDFAAAILRGSVATEHYKSSGGDILEIQEILNHASAHTSDIYVRGPEVRRIQSETIGRLQGLMVTWITGMNVEAAPLRTPADERAVVPFGHDCLNPMAGLAEGSQPGRLCPNFGGCLRCPGLVIPLDAPHLANILRAKAAFENARFRIDPQRWTLLYAPSYDVLVNEILPDFKSDLYAEAQALTLRLAQLPELE